MKNKEKVKLKLAKEIEKMQIENLVFTALFCILVGTTYFTNNGYWMYPFIAFSILWTCKVFLIFIFSILVGYKHNQSATQLMKPESE